LPNGGRKKTYKWKLIVKKSIMEGKIKGIPIIVEGGKKKGA